MAMSDHLLRYRQETDDDLIAEKTRLKAQETVFNQQQQGGTSMTRDLKLLTDKINAVCFVLAERGSQITQRAPNDQSFGVTDFSGV